MFVGLDLDAKALSGIQDQLLRLDYLPIVSKAGDERGLSQHGRGLDTRDLGSTFFPGSTRTRSGHGGGLSIAVGSQKVDGDLLDSGRGGHTLHFELGRLDLPGLGSKGDAMCIPHGLYIGATICVVPLEERATINTLSTGDGEERAGPECMVNIELLLAFVSDTLLVVDVETDDLPENAVSRSS